MDTDRVGEELQIRGTMSREKALQQIKAMLARPRPAGSAVDPIAGQLTRDHLEWLVAEIDRLVGVMEGRVWVEDNLERGCGDEKG